MAKTKQQALEALRVVPPHLVVAVDDVRAAGNRPQLGVLSTRADGSGAIGLRIDDVDTFLEDLSMVLDAPPLSPDDVADVRAVQFLHRHNLSVVDGD